MIATLSLGGGKEIAVDAPISDEAVTESSDVVVDDAVVNDVVVSVGEIVFVVVGDSDGVGARFGAAIVVVEGVVGIVVGERVGCVVGIAVGIGVGIGVGIVVGTTSN
jgi:hypothetical protein